MVDSAESYSGTSMRWPLPVRWRASSAARMPWARYWPAMMSNSDTPMRVGGPFSSPVIAIMPTSACAIGS